MLTGFNSREQEGTTALSSSSAVPQRFLFVLSQSLPKTALTASLSMEWSFALGEGSNSRFWGSGYGFQRMSRRAIFILVDQGFTVQGLGCGR